MIVPLNGDMEIKGAPKSYWTKKRIIAVARIAGANDTALETINKFPLEELLKIVLRPTGYCLCGSSKNPLQRSKTMYWRVDTDFIKSLGAVE